MSARPDHPLDRPVWSALASRQRALALGGGLARRFDPVFGPFAAAADDSPEALDALAELIPPGGRVILLQANGRLPPRGAAIERTAAALQMVATAFRPADRGIMVERLGDFFGVRERGRLVAMAGERMKPEGFTEVSAVCVHPEHRGRGYAAQLASRVTSRILERGEAAFLHVYAVNAGAIALYEALGFAVRREVTMTALARPE